MTLSLVTEKKESIRGDQMTEKELQFMEQRSQSQQFIMALEKEINRIQEELRLAWRLAFAFLLIAAAAMGALMAFVQSAGII